VANPEKNKIFMESGLKNKLINRINLIDDIKLNNLQ